MTAATQAALKNMVPVPGTNMMRRADGTPQLMPPSHCESVDNGTGLNCYFFAKGNKISYPLVEPSIPPPTPPLWSAGAVQAPDSIVPEVFYLEITPPNIYVVSTNPTTIKPNDAIPNPPPFTPTPVFDLYNVSGHSNKIATITIQTSATPPPQYYDGYQCYQTTSEFAYTNIYPGLDLIFFSFYPVSDEEMISAPCTTPTPAPTPIAAIAVSQLAGDFTQDVHGTVTIYRNPALVKKLCVPANTDMVLSKWKYVSPYLLCTNTDEYTGGIALFRSDANGKYTFVKGGGGYYSVPELVLLGVPQAVATSLLGGMHV